MNGNRYALKIMLKSLVAPGQIDETTERASREVELMRQFNSPHLAKIGPIGLTSATICTQEVIYFTEVWIDGVDLKTLIQQNAPFFPRDIIQLGLEVSEAIELLWSKDIVRRDVKPGNIIRRKADGCAGYLGHLFSHLTFYASLSELPCQSTRQERTINTVHFACMLRASAYFMKKRFRSCSLYVPRLNNESV